MKKQTRPPFWLLKNSDGVRDGLWTLTVIAFVTTTLAYMLSIVHQLQFGENVIAFREFDGFGYAAVVLIPLISGYFGRRYTKAQNETAEAQAKVYAEIAKQKTIVKGDIAMAKIANDKSKDEIVTDEIDEEDEDV